MAFYFSPADYRTNYLNAVKLAQVSAEEEALQRRLVQVQVQKRDYERSLALAAARRRLAEERERTRLAEEQELAALTLQIEKQRQQRTLAESRLQQLRHHHHQSPVPAQLPAVAPKPVSIPKPTSLKEQLEARLERDESIEIRDTIQAILASLVDTVKPQQPVPSDSKGKGKAIPVEPTSRDVAHAFDLVRNIEAAFTTLEREFEFPHKLDLDLQSSTTSKLAFTANNHPVRYYEQSLTGLLLQLDQIDSFGNEVLRSVRKDLVGRVEHAIEELEREVEGRWKAFERKQSSSRANSPDTAQTIPQEQGLDSHDTVPQEQGANSQDTIPQEQEANSHDAVHQEQGVNSSDTLQTVSQEPAAETSIETVSQAQPTETVSEETPRLSEDSARSDAIQEGTITVGIDSAQDPVSSNLETPDEEDETEEISDSGSETFLEPTKLIETPNSRSAEDSDWSEVEA